MRPQINYYQVSEVVVVVFVVMVVIVVVVVALVKVNNFLLTLLEAIVEFCGCVQNKFHVKPSNSL